MAIGEVLNNFRKSDYGGKGPNKEDPPEEEGSEGPRLIKLTEEEVKGIGYPEGGEVTCTVTGRLEGNKLSVFNVSSSNGGGDEKDMAAEMMGKSPMMQSQTLPSPS